MCSVDGDGNAELITYHSYFFSSSSPSFLFLYLYFSTHFFHYFYCSYNSQSLEEILSPSDKIKQRETQKHEAAIMQKCSNNKSDASANVLLESVVYAEGGETVTSLRSKREQGQAVVVVIEKLKKDFDSSLLPSNKEINTYTVKLTDLSLRHQSLTNQLKVLEEEMATIDGKKKVCYDMISYFMLCSVRCVILCYDFVCCVVSCRVMIRKMLIVIVLVIDMIIVVVSIIIYTVRAYSLSLPLTHLTLYLFIYLFLCLFPGCREVSQDYSSELRTYCLQGMYLHSNICIL